LEAVAFFSDPARPHAYAVQVRWRNVLSAARGMRLGVGRGDRHRKTWRCKECKRQFSVRVGTIFEDSQIPFSRWLPALWPLSNTDGTSSCEFGRAPGVTRQTAWFMLHRIREMMRTRTPSGASSSAR
jgi:transposase-like protein